MPGIRCGGVRKASTVWRQVATAGDPNRLLPSRSYAPAAVRTAIEYEYRFTEYRPPRRTEYEYDEIRCEGTNEKITEDEDFRHQHQRCPRASGRNFPPACAAGACP